VPVPSRDALPTDASVAKQDSIARTFAPVLMERPAAMFVLTMITWRQMMMTMMIMKMVMVTFNSM